MVKGEGRFFSFFVGEEKGEEEEVEEEEEEDVAMEAAATCSTTAVVDAEYSADGNVLGGIMALGFVFPPSSSILSPY